MSVDRRPSVRLASEIVDYVGQIEALSKSQAIMEFGLDGTILTANRNFLEILGYSLEEIAGKHHRVLVDAATRASVEYRRFWRKLSRGEYQAGQFKRIGKDGGEVWVLATYNPVLDNKGKPFKVVKVATDVTAQQLKIVQDAAQIEAMGRSQAVIEFGLDGVILSANENYLRLMGYTLAEIAGRHHRMFVETEVGESAGYQAFWESLGKGEFQAAEFKRIGKDGREIWLQASYNPILDATEKPLKVIKFATDVTARKAAEARVAEYRGLLDALPDEKLRLFENIVKQARDAVLITEAEPFDAPGPRILYSNPAFTRMTGYSFDEVLGKSPRILQGPLTARTEAARVKAALSNWEPVEVELQNYRKDGTTFWVHLSISPICDENGWYTHWISVQRDVTERKHQEERLRSSASLLDRTGRLAGVGGWELDIASSALTWSAETFRIYGLPSGNPPRVEDAINFYAPAARPVIAAAVAKCIAQGESYDLELPFIRADGEAIWVRSMGTLESADGKPVRLSGAFQDITEKVTERQVLQDANTRVTIATESGGIGIWDWDIVNDKMVWDEWMYRLYGIRAEDDTWGAYELWRRHLHPDDVAAAEQALRDGLTGIGPFDIEFRICWTDGSVHHIRGTGRVTRDSAGRALRMVGANWDVTKKFAEKQALQEATEALARTAVELNRSNDELNQFATLASHDLQEPLRMVSSYTELLSRRYKGRLDDEADEYMAFAVDGARRMQRMIRDMLDYSRIGKGIVFADIASGDVLQDALENLWGAIDDSGALVTYDALPRVMADATQLCQLLQNLVGNAVKYRGDKIPRVHVAAAKIDGGRWEFSVRDEGIGIDPRDFERIFGMLQRLPESLKYSGTGIGLAICKKIAELHGGAISVESQVGVGSVFRFSLAGV
jgi:PAS domain S-box-containing protein